MTNFIDQVRKANEAHEDERLRRLSAGEKLLIEQREREDREAQAWADDAIVVCRQHILREASAGKKCYFYSVGCFEDQVSDRSVLRCKALTKLLVADGFTVKRSTDTHEPCGSDSYFSNTCYSTYIKVSW